MEPLTRGMVLRYGIAFICVCLALTFFFLRIDRRFIDLTPTEGLPNSVVVEAGSTYEQYLTIPHPSINRLGMYMTPTSKQVPAGNITVTVSDQSRELITQDVPSVFIDRFGPTQIRFPEPLSLDPGTVMRFTVTVPPALSGAFRMQTRTPDESVNDPALSFVINGTAQSSVLAHQVYFSYRSPFVRQLAGLLLLGAIAVLWWPTIRAYQTSAFVLYAIFLAFLVQIPILMNGLFYPWLLGAQALGMAAMSLVIMRLTQNSMAALLAGHAFALTSWFWLHIPAGHNGYSVVAFLPLVLMTLYYARSSKRTITLLLGIGVIFTVCAYIYAPTPLPLPTATLRDVFVDPNQVSDSHKVVPFVSWDHYGSYLGIPTLMLAIIGLVSYGWTYRRLSLVMVLGTFIIFTPIFQSTLSSSLQVAVPHFVIFITCILAYFSAWGFIGLHRFLGEHSKLVTTLLFLIVVISLLDFLYVGSNALEYELNPF